MIQSMLYGWVFGIERGEAELHQGAHLRVPQFVQYVLKFVTPLYLIVIFGVFVGSRCPNDRVMKENHVVLASVCFIATVFVFLLILVHIAGRRWERERPLEL